MRAIRLTLTALATLVLFATAHADEAKAAEVVVVTAKRPVAIETRDAVAVEIETLSPSVDFTSLTIEPPKLETAPEDGPARTELAIADEAPTKS